MAARCLRCGAGNEWIEGGPTVTTYVPRKRRRPPAYVADLERFKAAHGDWPALGSKDIARLIRAAKRGRS